MTKTSSSLRSTLNPREEVKLRLEQEESDKYRKIQEQANPIFWESKGSEKMSIIQKLRTRIWFFPDYLLGFIYETRPFSFILIYSALALILWQSVTFAYQKQGNIFNLPEEQVLVEGVVGHVNSINPMFITHNQTERDLQELVFNQLVSIAPDGSAVPELAESWAISNDGRAYTVFLRKDVKWHDGERFTADDVVFTFESIQKLIDEDSFASALEEVQINKLDDYTVGFQLKDPNVTFTESLAIGIVPKHVLENTRTADIRVDPFNSYPIGTGPFKIVENNDTEVILDRNKDYFLGTPKLQRIVYKFYPDSNAVDLELKQFEIHTYNNPPYKEVENIKEYSVFKNKTFTMNLRTKLIFFNLRDQGPLQSEKVRHALSTATDKQELVDTVGYHAEPAGGPISKKSWAYDDSLDRYGYDEKRAIKFLEDDGWKLPSSDNDEDTQYREKNGAQLSIKLSLLDSEANNTIANNLQKQWKKLGIKLVIDTQSYEKLVSETIPRRDFEALLFEVENTPDPDKYNLWHSLNSDYPGLNLSGYSYDRVDILLERARKKTSQEERKEDYSLFQKYFLDDMPALYLFHPTYSFIAHESVRGLELEDIGLPHERYHNVEKWYIER
ncbi:hypothetical protein JW710_01945 [Candidatus Dojkabacteria bacterium]|nr:hypothetical protein [Candidatus Dojkabacteria bacterium]